MSYKICTYFSDDEQMHRGISFLKPALDWGMMVLLGLASLTPNRKNAR